MSTASGWIRDAKVGWYQEGEEETDEESEDGDLDPNIVMDRSRLWEGHWCCWIFAPFGILQAGIHTFDRKTELDSGKVMKENVHLCAFSVRGWVGAWLTILIRDLHRNRTSSTHTHTHTHTIYLYIYSYSYICIYLSRERDFKELAHMIARAGKSEICRAGQQAGNSGKSWCCSLESEFLNRLENSGTFCVLQSWGELQKILVFALKAFNWSDETHPRMEGDLLYPKSPELNINHTWKIAFQEHLDWCSPKQLSTTA